MLATGQPVDQIGFYRAECQIVARFPNLGAVFQHPANLAAREIGVKQKPGFGLYHLLQALGFQRIAFLRRAPVLPDNRFCQRFAAALVPGDHRLPLVGDADCGDLVRSTSLFDHFLAAAQRLVPDFRGIMLHQTRCRIILLQRLLLRTVQLAMPVKQHRPCRGRALVDDQYILHHYSALSQPVSCWFTLKAGGQKASESDLYCNAALRKSPVTL